MDEHKLWNQSIVFLFFFIFTLVYYHEILFYTINGDTLNIKNGCCFITHFLFSILLYIDVMVFKVFYLFFIACVGFLIYNFSPNWYSIFFALFVLTYDKFIFYVTGLDTIPMMIPLIFLYLNKQNILTVLFMASNRIEYSIFLLKERYWLFLFIIPIMINFSFAFKFNFYPMFIPYQLNDFSFFGFITIITGFIGMYQLRRFKKYRLMIYVMLYSYIWVYVYGDSNPRYFLPFFTLWYYFAFYPMYTLCIYILKHSICNHYTINNAKTLFMRKPK